MMMNNVQIINEDLSIIIDATGENNDHDRFTFA